MGRMHASGACGRTTPEEFTPQVRLDPLPPYRILTEGPVRLSMRGGIISLTLKRGPVNNILLKQETIIIPPFLIGQTNYPATSVMWAVIIPLFFDRRNNCPE